MSTALRKISTKDIILRPKYVLSLVVPFYMRESWEFAVNFAVKLQNIPSDFRMNLTKYKQITQQNSCKKFGYVNNYKTTTINT